eukprot:4882553-Pleurochrysis_carterae.AAC.2
MPTRSTISESLLISDRACPKSHILHCKTVIRRMSSRNLIHTHMNSSESKILTAVLGRPEKITSLSGQGDFLPASAMVEYSI